MRPSTAFMSASLLLAGCDPLANVYDPEVPAKVYQASALKAETVPAATASVMTWNLKFAGGRIDFYFDCYGDREVMARQEVLDNLKGLEAKISQVDPDILFVQECDVASFRVANVDMMQELLDHTHLNYGVYASHWKSQYIPSHNFRNMDSGNGILSRWKLHDGTRYALALRTDLDDLTRQFYLKRNMLQAVVDIPGHGSRTLVDNHTEAYDTDGTRRKHILSLEARLDQLDKAGVKFVAGGDMNTLPPGTRNLKGFADQVCNDPMFPRDDYTGQENYLGNLYTRWDAAIPLTTYAASNDPWFSFTADKKGFWNRTLDHLWTNARFVPGSGLVHQDKAHGGMETMPLSDHAPLSVWLEL